MGIENLERIFRPASVAVIGANARKGSVGEAVLRNLATGGYKGRIHLINPAHRKVEGRRCVPSVSDLDEAPDLALVATPMEAVPDIVGACARTGAGGAVVLSAGGRETGQSGRDLESRIAAEARSSGLRIIGPNSMGVVSGAARLNASLAGAMPLPGKTAFISQSGSIYTAILDLSLREKMGFSHFVSLGSMLDVDFADLIDYLGWDFRVGAIVLYLESLSRFRPFMSAARAVSRIKPIIAFKGGRSPAGAVAAASHTGALTGEDDVYEAAFKRAGILRVRTFEELFDCAELVAKSPRSAGPRLAILTNAGGPGVLAVDALADHGVAPAALSEETIGRLDAVLPPYWSRANPVDILANATPERYCQAARILMAAKEADGLLILLAPNALCRPSAVAGILTELFKSSQRPVFTTWIGGPAVEEGRRIFDEAGIPTFDTPERAVRAFMDLRHYGRALEMLQEIPPKLPDRLQFDPGAARKVVEQGRQRDPAVLTEPEAKDLLSAYGIPVNPTRTAETGEAAWEAARDLGPPVVLKILSPDISHKSDDGGVRLDLTRREDILDAYDRIVRRAEAARSEARIRGVTVQPLIRRVHYELLLGIHKDPHFGPVILFGAGGVAAEILRDRSLALPPLNRLLARRLMEGTRVFGMLRGFRNRPPADLAALEEILIRLAQLAVDFPEIAELDINPLMVTGGRIMAADARAVLVAPAVHAPDHLVISPYPNQYEGHAAARTGEPLFIRPIRPEDAPLFLDLFHALSPQSVYFRFFSAMKSLRHEMLAKFTQIDYDREMALVALLEDGDGEQMVGVARIILEPGGREAEFAVLVRDAWQGRGVGAELLQRCLDIAKEWGLKKVNGIVLPENKNMLALGRKLGFAVRRDPDGGDYLLSLELS